VSCVMKQSLLKLNSHLSHLGCSFFSLLPTGCKRSWCSPSCQNYVGETSGGTYMAARTGETHEGTPLVIYFSDSFIPFVSCIVSYV